MLRKEYIAWNKAILDYFVPVDQNGALEEVLLCVSPRSLAQAWAMHTGDELTPDEAEQDFTDAAGVAYRQCVRDSTARLRVFQHLSEGLPQCAAFLALSVLAAYNMRSEGGTSSGDYYQRLIDLLQVNEHGNVPQDFKTSEFEDLWLYLSGWMQSRRRRVLKFPSSNAHRFVGYPLAHVPLRRLDVEKLPDFFLWARYDAHGTVEHDRLCDDLKRWVTRGPRFSQAGQNALSDGRLETVAEQAAQELKAWDGAIIEENGRRLSLIEVQLEQVRRRWQVSLLARRPEGFPDPFKYPGGELHSSDDGWYQTITLDPEDSALLEGGFAWHHRESSIRTTLSRTTRAAIAFTPDRHFPGLISRRGLPMRGEFAVLCQDHLLPAVQSYLSAICDQPLQILQPPTLPRGWNLLNGAHIVRRPAQTPAELDGLEVSSTVEVTLRGGLRLGRGMKWLLGAPPQIQISGLDGEIVTLDGQPLEVSDSGLLDLGSLLDTEGVHVLQVGNAPHKIEIASPDAAPPASSPVQEEVCTPAPMLFLPMGEWILLGAVPGQVARVHLNEWRSQAAACSFEAMWAVSAESAREAVAIQVHPAPPPPPALSRSTSLTASPNVRAWAEAFYRVHSRHPRMASLYKIEQTSLLWSTYADAARQVKRRLGEKGRTR